MSAGSLTVSMSAAKKVSISSTSFIYLRSSSTKKNSWLPLLLLNCAAPVTQALTLSGLVVPLNSLLAVSSASGIPATLKERR
ncbi:unnamed protein product [Brassica oleracea var. botrytis]